MPPLRVNLFLARVENDRRICRSRTLNRNRWSVHRTLFIVVGVGFLLSVPTHDADAGWPPEGVLVCQDCRAREPVIAGDGTGGAFVAWRDARNDVDGTNPDVFLQRLTASGNLASGWPINGLPICTEILPQYPSAIVPDASGGALIVWPDFRHAFSGTTGMTDIYAQRVPADGSLAPGWPVNGAAVSRTAGRQDVPTAAADGVGGAFFTWDDSSYDIYLQHLTATGEVASGWTANGIVISAHPALQEATQVIADGIGGALIAWGDFREGPVAAYAQRVTASGAMAPGWPAGGARLVLDRYIRGIVLDDTGGGYLSCTTNGPFLDADYYLVRFNGDGTIAPGWPASGAPVCVGVPDERYGLRMQPDGAGGALLTWYDYRDNDFTADIYLARIQPDGTTYPGWPANGLRVTDYAGFDIDSDLASDGTGGAFLSWNRQLGNGDHTFVQRIRGDAAIAPGWPPQGHLIPTQYVTGGAPSLQTGVAEPSSPGRTVTNTLAYCACLRMDRWPYR